MSTTTPQRTVIPQRPSSASASPAASTGRKSTNGGGGGGGGSLSAMYGNSALSANETFGSLGNREDLHQTELNVKLFATVQDDCEALQSCYENLLFAISNKREQALHKCEKNKEHVDSAAKLWKWTKPLLWDFEKLIRHFNFNLSPTEIQMHHEFVEFSFEEPGSALEALRTASSMSRARVATLRDTLRPIDKQFYEAAVSGGSSGTAPVSKFCIALYEMAHTDVLSHARNELSRSESHLAQLEAQIESDRAQRDLAIARGDIPGIEPPHRNMIRNYVELLEALQRRIVNLTSTDEETNIFRKNCAEVVAGARELIDKLGDESRALQQRCLADVRRSEAVRCEEAAIDAEAASKHKEYVIETKQHLDKNTHEQKVVLDKIHELAKELFRLTEKRKAIVDDFTANKEKEELRSANYEEFGCTRTEHQPYVDRIRDLTERRLAAEAGLNEYVNEMQRRFADMDIEGMLDELVDPELRRYIQTYRNLAFTVGELITKKGLRIESLLRQRRQLKLQQEVAVTSLDSELGTYVKKHDELTRALNAAQSDLAFLQNTQSAAEKNYAAIGALQQRFGLQCIHPLVEFAAMAAEERQKFADVTTRYIEDESIELDRSKCHVKQLMHMNEVERQQQSPVRNSAAAIAQLNSLASAGNSRPATAAAGDHDSNSSSRPATSAALKNQGMDL